MAKPARKLTSSAIAALERVRTAASKFADVEESTSFGNPSFRVRKKAFAVIDRYEDRDCLWVRVGPSNRQRLLKRRGWFPSPYDPGKTALCCALVNIDWRSMRSQLRASYELALFRPRKVPK